LSRSIHTTRRHLRELQRADFADEAHKQRRIQQVRTALEKKHAIKVRVRQPSAEADLAGSGTPVDVDSIPIEVRDEQEYVHYPASVADLRAVLCRLPPGTLDGLSRIVLALGADYLREQAESGEGYGDPDPLVGRISAEEWPGVYSGAFYGEYEGNSASIWLFAYVYDASLMPDRALREHWLRLQMLETLLYEVAEHHDHTIRDTRGRWSTRPEGLSQLSAAKQQYAWMLEHAIPYLEEQYSEVTKALEDWLYAASGVIIPLAQLANHYDETFYYSEDAICELFAEVDKGSSRQDVRRGFAFNLHLAYRNDEALEVIAAILAEHPDDLKTLTLQAEIYEDDERHGDAEQVARTVVDRDPANLKAWGVLLHVFGAQGRWQELETAASRVIALEHDKPAEDDSSHLYNALIERTCARIELGDLAGAEADLQRVEQRKRRRRIEAAESLRAWLLLRSGRYEEALRAAQRHLPSTRRILPIWGVLIAVRYEAAQRLGRPREAGTISSRAAQLLRHFGHGAWLDRLTADYGLRVWSKNRI
jgi:tetratricopeptide (TPR) repeat protein